MHDFWLNKNLLTSHPIEVVDDSSNLALLQPNSSSPVL